MNVNNQYVGEVDEQIHKVTSNKVEHKFKIGDFIKHNKANFTCKVISVNSGSYYVKNITGSGCIELFNAEQNFHLWTIQDAKNGDVLFCKENIKYSNTNKYNRICLFNNINNAYFILIKTFNCEEYDVNVNIDYPEDTVPATKVQKEILFMVMKEAGYEWDAEKKELKMNTKIFSKSV